MNSELHNLFNVRYIYHFLWHPLCKFANHTFFLEMPSSLFQYTLYIYIYTTTKKSLNQFLWAKNRYLQTYFQATKNKVFSPNINPPTSPRRQPPQCYVHWSLPCHGHGNSWWMFRVAGREWLGLNKLIDIGREVGRKGRKHTRYDRNSQLLHEKDLHIRENMYHVLHKIDDKK